MEGQRVANMNWTPNRFGFKNTHSKRDQLYTTLASTYWYTHPVVINNEVERGV